jgi:hypothetical protein
VSWRVDGPEGPLAGGGRTYRRRRECLYAVNTFVAALDVAQPPPAPVRLVKVTWATWRRGEVMGEHGQDGAAPADLIASALPRAVTSGETA